jgi:hypothetical protein
MPTYSAYGSYACHYLGYSYLALAYLNLLLGYVCLGYSYISLCYAYLLLGYGYIAYAYYLGYSREYFMLCTN